MKAKDMSIGFMCFPVEIERRLLAAGVRSVQDLLDSDPGEIDTITGDVGIVVDSFAEVGIDYG